MVPNYALIAEVTILLSMPNFNAELLIHNIPVDLKKKAHCLPFTKLHFGLGTCVCTFIPLSLIAGDFILRGI